MIVQNVSKIHCSFFPEGMVQLLWISTRRQSSLLELFVFVDILCLLWSITRGSPKIENWSNINLYSDHNFFLICQKNSDNWTTWKNIWWWRQVANVWRILRKENLYYLYQFLHIIHTMYLPTRIFTRGIFKKKFKVHVQE